MVFIDTDYPSGDLPIALVYWSMNDGHVSKRFRMISNDERCEILRKIAKISRKFANPLYPGSLGSPHQDRSRVHIVDRVVVSASCSSA